MGSHERDCENGIRDGTVRCYCVMRLRDWTALCDCVMGVLERDCVKGTA